MTDVITSGKQLAGWAADLTDEEIQKTVSIVNAARAKYAGLPNTAENLEKLRDEMLTRLADINILAEFDPTPSLYGEPPQVEIIGKVSTDPIHKYGFDHEKKAAEVRKAKELGEDYRGQKESYNKRKKSHGEGRSK